MPPKIRESLPPELVPNHAVRALIALGYEPSAAHDTVQTIHEKTPTLELEALIRESLKVLCRL